MRPLFRRSSQYLTILTEESLMFAFARGRETVLRKQTAEMSSAGMTAVPWMRPAAGKAILKSAREMITTQTAVCLYMTAIPKTGFEGAEMKCRTQAKQHFDSVESNLIEQLERTRSASLLKIVVDDLLRKSVFKQQFQALYFIADLPLWESPVESRETPVDSRDRLASLSL